MEKQVCHKDAGHNSCQVGNKPGRDSVTRAFDAYIAEVKRNNVKSGVGRGVNYCRKPACEGIGPGIFQNINGDALCASATKRFHEGDRERIYKIGIYTKVIKTPGYPRGEIVQRATSPEYTYPHQHANQVRNYFDHGIEALFRSFDEGRSEEHTSELQSP